MEYIPFRCYPSDCKAVVLTHYAKYVWMCKLVFARYTVKELLQHDFFLEETGIKVDLAENQEPDGERIRMWLRVVDPKKHKPSHKPNEAIEFEYNLGSDDPETLAKEMVSISVSVYSL